MKRKHKPAKYTCQTCTTSGSFGCALGTDVFYAHTKKEAEAYFEKWRQTHVSVGASKEDARLTVWLGIFADVTDQYPDFQIVSGPRGGHKWVIC